MGWVAGLSSVLLLLALLQPGQGQNDNLLDNFQFYMDSNADCNGPERDIGDKRAYVYGKGADQLDNGPLKCILRLRSVTAFETNRLRVQIPAMVIRDDFVTFSIFDGSENQILLRSFDKNNVPDVGDSQDIITTGSSVTLVLERRDLEHTLYNIQLVVNPVILGEPGYENNNGNDYGYYYKRLSNIGLMGIVVGIFGLAIIVVVIISIYCYRSQRGMTARWEKHKLSNVHTMTSLKPPPSSKGPMSVSSTAMWASEAARNYGGRPPPRSLDSRSRATYPSEDEDSVFDESMERRRPHDIPPKYSRYGRPPRGGGPPPRRSYKNDSFDDSFVQASDDHPQNAYIERVIEPRVRTSRPPRRSAATHTAGVGTEGDDEPPPDDSEEEEEEEDTEEEEEDSEEEEEEEEEEEDPPPKVIKPKAPPRKSLAQTPASSRDTVDEQAAPQPASVQLPPGNAPYPMVMQPGMGPQYLPMGYAMPPPYQPMVMAPPNPPAPQVQPTEPPIYSYLVQRGYIPTGRESPDSVSTAASAGSNSRLLRDHGAERAGGLDSGVELMRR